MSGCPFGKGLRVDGHVWVRVRAKGAVRLGEHVSINSRFGSNLVGLSTPMVLECFRGGHITIGDHSGCSGTVISSRSSVTIGRHVKVGGGVRIYDHDFHSLDSELRRDRKQDWRHVRSAPVAIGDDVFIAAGALILKGVAVGDGSIVAAAAVVTKDIPAGEVWGGNPARPLKQSHA